MSGLLFSGVVHAYDEIQVYGDDINQPGQFGLEMHVNYAFEGRSTPAYKGELPPDQLLAITNEFSYGLTPHIELGLYLPISIDVQNNRSFMDYAKGRIKFLNADDLSLFYGLNIEFGAFPRRYSDQSWGGELRPIVGSKLDDWFFAFNPNLNFSVQGNIVPDFNPSFKITHSFFDNVSLGFEHYAGFSKLGHFHRTHEHGHTTYLVTDITLEGIDINLGIGHGWDENSDDWTAKLIVGGIPFMDWITPR